MNEIAGGAELADLFAELARQLQAEATPETTWQRVTDIAVFRIPGAEHAAISLMRPGGQIDTVASTSSVATEVDVIQYATGEGPCLSAIREEGVFVTGDLAAEQRWPAFSARATRQTGVHSMLSLRLFAHDESLGALNLYSGEVDAFDELAHGFAQVFAAHAALAMSAAGASRHVEQLESALSGSRVIGVAVGILMAGQDGPTRRFSPTVRSFAADQRQGAHSCRTHRGRHRKPCFRRRISAGAPARSRP